MDRSPERRGRMKIGITCYPTFGGSGAGATELVPARLVLPGDGPEHPRAQGRAESLGPGDSVLLRGRRTRVDELLSCAGLFVLPSSSESFGLAALEAGAAGTPVVASRAGGIPEAAPDAEAGFRFEAGDQAGTGEIP